MKNESIEVHEGVVIAHSLLYGLTIVKLGNGSIHIAHSMDGNHYPTGLVVDVSFVETEGETEVFISRPEEESDCNPTKG